MPSPPCRPLDDDAVPAAVALLADAFADDPAFVWAVPAPARAAAVRRIEQAVVALHAPLGASWVAGGDDVVGAAIWRPAGVRLGVLDQLRQGLGRLALTVGPRGLQRMLAVQGRMAAHLRAHPHHDLLDTLGVRADVRGQGIGRALLAAHRDATGGAPACLFTTRPRNVAFYEANGFALRASERLGDVELAFLTTGA
ncbi:MAG: GNAT family N-acetyltransferase [Myxococcota bacterium]